MNDRIGQQADYQYAGETCDARTQPVTAAYERKLRDGKASQYGLAGTSGIAETPLGAAKQILEADAKHRSLQADQILMLSMLMPSVTAQWRQLSEGMHQWFRHQGFWGKGNNISTLEQENLKKTEKLALIMTEIAECVEAVRKGDLENEAEELADTMVRIFDYAGGFNVNLGAAFHKKMEANYSRPFRHNKGF